MRVAIVILNWNGLSFLESFLPGVVRFSRNMADVVVADNNSTDGSIAYLRAQFPEVRIVENKSNLGFAGGYNAALKELKYTYYVLLNSDVEVSDNWIAPVIEMMDGDHQIAACQPKIRSYKQKEKFEYAGAAGGFIDKFGYPFCRGRIFSTLENDEGQYDDAIEIFWATGACLFLRAEVFHQLAGFDEEFFAHMEEIDLCWRMHNSGYKIMYCPASTVYHVGGGTLPKNSPRKTYFNFRNNLMMIYKNAERKELSSILIFRSVFDFIAAILFLFTSGWPDCKAVFKAHRYFHRYRKLHPRTGNTEIPHPSSHFIYPESILFRYFIFRDNYFSSLKHFRK